MNNQKKKCSFCCCDSNAFGAPWENVRFRFVICARCKGDIMERRAWRICESEVFNEKRRGNEA
jgi:hypothetical protein